VTVEPRLGESGAMKGKFLVFEGLDGSGKSTLIRGLEAELRKRGLGLRLTREPGGTPLAEDIRRLLLRTDGEAPVPATELLLYAASRAQHVESVIRPALVRGEWVLCDRFTASTVAFQCFARKLVRSEVDWLNVFATKGLCPDLTILLDLSVEESRKRQSGRSGVAADRMEKESEEFHQAVREGYLAQAKENPSEWLVLDANLGPDELVQRTLREFKERGWLES